MKKIVVIGGGFGGLYFAKHLSSSAFEITLIDRRNHHLFQPLLYQVATGGLSPGDIAYPIRSVLAQKKQVRVVQDEVIQFEKSAVITKKGRYDFDYLIVAAGAQNFYFGKTDWEQVAPGLKSIEDALSMRTEILSPLEKAETETDAQKRDELLTFAVIGAGPTGVELCGALAELTQKTLKGAFRNIRSEDARIVMIEAGDRVLSSFTNELSENAKHSLEKLG
ncbi:NAD(P)/FAD-dependent oxidoreductase, partial [Nodularia spumigena]|uniref:NAD(P)/FAD-dependent oxidoreductase n=1 Tax=Nodularia spumigena TaxID=70799 RepID=UPI002B217E3C